MGATPIYAGSEPISKEDLTWDPANGYPPEHVRIAIGRKIAQLLEEKGWKQSELAKRANIGRDSISLYVRGKTVPTPASLGKIANALGVAPDDIAPLLGQSTVARFEAAGDMLSPVALNLLQGGKARLRVDAIVDAEIAIKVVAMVQEALGRK